MTKKEEVIPLFLEMDAGGRPFPVHAAALWDGEEATVVDTGIPGQLELIRSALENDARYKVNVRDLEKALPPARCRDVPKVNEENAGITPSVLVRSEPTTNKPSVRIAFLLFWSKIDT